MMQKKYIALLLTVILFFQAIPFSAQAEGELTDAEISAARSLAGISDDAAGFHSGAAVSVENMNARELREHLDGILDSRIHSLENYYEDIENELARLEKEDPASYSAFTSGRYAGMAEEVHSRFRQMEGVRMKLEYWTAHLSTNASVIEGNLFLLDEGSGTDYETRLRNHRIRQASEEIRSIRSEVTEQLDGCTAQLDEWIQEMANPASSLGLTSGVSVGGWATELLHTSDSAVMSASFSASSLFPRKQTLLGRLSPISTAQADESDSLLRVLDDHHNLVEVKDRNNQPIQGAKVTVTDIRADENPKIIDGETDAGGQLVFENAGFIMKDDRIAFSLEIQADGYQIAWCDEVDLKKGGAFHIGLISLPEGNASPYVAGCSFDGHDCLFSDYNALYSPDNDYVNPISVMIVNPSDQDCIVHLMYQDADSKQYYHTMGAENSDGKEDTSAVTVPAGGRVELVTRREWRRKLKPGGNPFDWTVDGATVTGSSKEVLQIAIQDSGRADTGFTKGSPALTTGHYSVTSTLLTVEAAKLEEPIVNVAMTGNFFTQGLNFLNYNFPIDSKLGPWFSSGQIGGEIPFMKLIPRISAARNGCASIVLGTDPGVFTDKNGPLYEYKSKDSKVIEESLTEQDKSNRFKKKIMTGYRTGLVSTSGGLKLPKAKATVGVFIGLVFRLDKEQSPADGEASWTSMGLSGLFGVVPCLNLDLTYQSAVGPVPYYVGVNFDVSAAVAGMLGGKVAVNSLTDLANEGYTGINLEPKFTGLSVLINLTATLSAGVGVKNVADVSINGYGSISMLLEVKGNKFTHLKVWAVGGAYIKIEVFFAHYKQTIYDSPEWVIYEGSWPKSSARTAQRAFSSIFLSSAQAEEGGDDEPLPQTETAKSLKATDYPELTAESQKVADSIGQKKGSAMKLLEIEGQMYAFYLQSEAGENKRTRVAWLNLATGHSGTFADALKRAGEKKSLISDPDNKIGEYAWTNIITPQESSVRESNAVLYDQDDVAFDVTSVSIYGTATADIIRTYYKSLHVLAVFNADTTGTDDSNLSIKGTPSLYTLAFKRDKFSGDLTADLEGLRQDRLPDPSITWNLLFSVGAAGTEEQLKDYFMSGVSVSSILYVQENNAGRYWVAGTNEIAFGNNRPDFENILPVYDGSGGIEEWYSCTAQNQTDAAGYLWLGTVPFFGYQLKTYYSLEDSSDSDGTYQTLTYHSPYPDTVIEKDAVIPYFQILNKTEMDYLFYVTAEEDSGNMLYHLKAANLEHKANYRDLPTFLFTDLDVTIPGARFRVQEIRGTIYVYWLESLADENDRSKMVYRLRGVVYDPNTGIASDDIILAQFYPEDNLAMEDMLLTDLGCGFYVMDNSIYSFPFRLKASLDLDDVTLVDDVIGEGENDMVHIRLVNNGNMAISAFSLVETAVEMVADETTGQLTPTGDETEVLTVDCNTLDASQNRVHLKGDDEDLDLTGKEAIWRELPAMDGVTQDYWEVKQVIRTFAYEGESSNYDITYSDSDITELDIDAMEIMPGQVAPFTLMIKVPSGWTGQTHRLKLALQNFSASTSVTGSMAMQSGLLPETGALQTSGTVTYQRSTDGTMRKAGGELQTGNSALIADEAGVPMDAILDHQLDNLVLRGRVYRHANGEKRLSLTISNDAVDHESIRLYCEVRYDGEETPAYMDLPYDSGSTAHARTHTIDLPLSAIDNGKNAVKAEITIHGIGIEETTLLDNRYEVILRDNDPLRIVVQPQDRSALAGETVTMTVQAAGGKPPYSYQWQEYLGESLGWRDIQGATSDMLTLENVTMGMNGRRYRCVVTDEDLDTVTSDEAVLTVRKLLPTGDASQPLLILLAAVALLACWFLIRRRQGKRT